jgi:hypothetical protein
LLFRFAARRTLILQLLGEGCSEPNKLVADADHALYLKRLAKFAKAAGRVLGVLVEGAEAVKFGLPLGSGDALESRWQSVARRQFNAVL